MCKVMAFAGIKQEKAAAAMKFIQAASPFMSERDDDGLGYAAITAQGDVFGERWLNPKDAFKRRMRHSREDVEVMNLLGDAVNAEVSYNSFGQLQSVPAAIILHSRMATCTKGIENTHPFVSGNVALIHNGVISNTRELKNITSTCDSECILNSYIDADVVGNPDKIQDVADELNGWYACAVLAKTLSGQPIMDVFKDDAAKLICAYVRELQAVVFCTTEEILRKTCRKAKMHMGTVFEVQGGMHIRLDASNGGKVAVTEFDPSYAFKNSRHYTGGEWRAPETRSHIGVEQGKVVQYNNGDVMVTDDGLADAVSDDPETVQRALEAMDKMRNKRTGTE